MGRVLFGSPLTPGFEATLALLLLGVLTLGDVTDEGEVTVGVVGAVGVPALLFCCLLLALRKKFPVKPPKFIFTIDGTAILIAIRLFLLLRRLVTNWLKAVCKESVLQTTEQTEEVISPVRRRCALLISHWQSDTN